nr:hypothetical protein GCM10025699_76510 [Microbacterium flavescens]
MGDLFDGYAATTGRGGGRRPGLRGGSRTSGIAASTRTAPTAWDEMFESEGGPGAPTPTSTRRSRA